jgi:uncharacterized protein YraI
MRSKFVPLVAAAALAASICPASAYQAYVSAPVNVHSGPGFRFAIVSTVPPGAPLDVMACRPRWCEVQFIGGGGFVEAPLLFAGAPPAAAYASANPFGFITAPFDAIGSAFGSAEPPASAEPPPVEAAY